MRFRFRQPVKGLLSDLLSELELSEPDWVPGVSKSIANGLLWDLLSKTRNLTCRNAPGAVGAGLPSWSIKINSKTVRSSKTVLPQTKMKQKKKSYKKRKCLTKTVKASNHSESLNKQ